MDQPTPWSRVINPKYKLYFYFILFIFIQYPCTIGTDIQLMKKGWSDALDMTDQRMNREIDDQMDRWAHIPSKARVRARERERQRETEIERRIHA